MQATLSLDGMNGWFDAPRHTSVVDVTHVVDHVVVASLYSNLVSPLFIVVLIDSRLVRM